MSQKLYDYADKDTPSFVNVPRNVVGLATWLFGRLGVGAIFLIMVYQVYEDNKKQMDRFMVVYEKQIEINAKQSASLSSIEETLKLQALEIRSLYERRIIDTK